MSSGSTSSLYCRPRPIQRSPHLCSTQNNQVFDYGLSQCLRIMNDAGSMGSMLPQCVQVNPQRCSAKVTVPDCMQGVSKQWQ
jgi:hypothetical protein